MPNNCIQPRVRRPGTIKMQFRKVKWGFRRGGRGAGRRVPEHSAICIVRDNFALLPLLLLYSFFSFSIFVIRSHFERKPFFRMTLFSIRREVTRRACNRACFSRRCLSSYFLTDHLLFSTFVQYTMFSIKVSTCNEYRTARLTYIWKHRVPRAKYFQSKLISAA